MALWGPPSPGEGVGLCRDLVSSVVRGCLLAGCATQGTWASLHVGDASDPSGLGGGECSAGRSEPGVGTAGAALGELRTCGFHTLTVSWRVFSIQNEHCHFHGSYHGPFETQPVFLLGRPNRSAS